MNDSMFWAGIAAVLLLEAFGYFIYTRIEAARRRRETRDAYIPPRGSGLDTKHK